MRLCGIVAEYNPFHLGHEYHLQEARKSSCADAVIVVMSGCVTQRGEFAILPPSIRARMALLGGADAVVLLPAVSAVRDAEHFADHGIHTLLGLGCSDISFGVENMQLELLEACARMLREEPPRFQEVLRASMKSGLSWPAAAQTALSDILPDAADLLFAPNNILALCYLRALGKYASSEVSVHPVLRRGRYHAQSLTEDTPGASAVRRALLQGNYEEALRFVPAHMHQMLLDAFRTQSVPSFDILEAALLGHFRRMGEDAWDHLPDPSEALRNRLRHATRTCSRLQDVVSEASTRSVPRSRVMRCMMQSFLGITHEALLLPPPREVLLLGVREARRDLIGILSRAAQSHGLSLITRAGEIRRFEKEPWIQVESRATDLYALACGQPSGSLYTSGLVIQPPV
ncbi:MAG: nucleotidyltransferase family protein [Clostridia bacterium]|nr:nucleotidyltransferase family protein [Clostridia bacterium]